MGIDHSVSSMRPQSETVVFPVFQSPSTITSARDNPLERCNEVNFTTLPRTDAFGVSVSKLDVENVVIT
jgi:hypothetical protein